MRKVVVVIDICASTSILEDLKQTDNLTPWRSLLIELKDSMLEQAVSKRPGLEVYKFIGDGWIVLLPTDVSQDGVAEFLTTCQLRTTLRLIAGSGVCYSENPLLSESPSG